MRIVSFLILSLLQGAAMAQEDCGVMCARRALAAKASVVAEGDELRSKITTLGGQLGGVQQESQACGAELQEAGKGESLEEGVKTLESDVSQLKKRVAQVQQLEGELAATKEETAKLVTAEQDFRQNRLPEVASFRKSREEVQGLLKEKQLEATKLKEAIATELATPAPYVNVEAIQRAVKDLVDSLMGKQ